MKMKSSVRAGHTSRSMTIISLVLVFSLFSGVSTAGGAWYDFITTLWGGRGSTPVESSIPSGEGDKLSVETTSSSNIDVAVADDPLIDPLIEAYLEDNNVALEEAANLMVVKHTLVDGKYLPAGWGIDEVMSSEEKLEDIFLAQVSTIVPLYTAKDDPSYYVGFANTMLGDEGVKAVDHAFAMLNWDGQEVTAKYDSATGIVRIPKALYDEENAVLAVQMQILQRLGTDPLETESDVDAMIEGEDVGWEAAGNNIFALETVVDVPADLDTNNLLVRVNGIPTEEFVYDSETNSVVIDMSSAAIASVIIEENPETFKEAMMRIFGPRIANAVSYNQMKTVGKVQLKATTLGQSTRVNAQVNSYTLGSPQGIHSLGTYGFHNSGEYQEEWAAAYLIGLIANGGTFWSGHTPTQSITVDGVFTLHEQPGAETYWMFATNLGAAAAANNALYDATGAGRGFTFPNPMSASGNWAFTECAHIKTPAVEAGIRNSFNSGWTLDNDGTSGTVHSIYLKYLYKDPASTYAVFGFVSSRIDTQNVCGIFKVDIEPLEGRGRIQKASGNTSITAGNSLYSLEGAEYRVYTTYNTTTGAVSGRVAILTTGANGRTSYTGNLAAGTYYVRETVAPPGYILDTTGGQYGNGVYRVTITAGQDVTWNMTDMPFGDPARILAYKLDGETSDGYPIAGKSVGGGIFEIKYYDQYFSDTTTATIEAATALCTWIVKTNDDGRAILREDFLQPGSSPLYKEGEDATIPNGTVTVREIQPPEFYRGDPTLYVREVKGGGSLTQATFFNPPDVPNFVKRADLRLYKKDAETDMPLDGAVFSITSKDSGETHNFVTNEFGYASTETSHTPHSLNTNRGQTSLDGVWFGLDKVGKQVAVNDTLGALPCGDYIVREVSPPPGYLTLEESWQLPYKEFTIGENDHGKVIEMEFENYVPREPFAEKYDDVTGLPVEDCIFELYSEDMKLLQTVATNEKGVAIFEGVPFGTYHIVEKTPNPNYATCEESGVASTQTITVDASNPTAIGVFENTAISIGTEIRKYTIGRTSAAFADQYGKVDNVEKERQLYHIHYRNLSNVFVDELVVIDELDAVRDGYQRVESMWTSVSEGDYDGLMNVWFKTNKTAANYMEVPRVCALDSNPFNPNNPDNKPCTSYEGWRLWKQDIACDTRTRLDVADLGLEADEYVTAFMYEHGRVESGFTTSHDIDWKGTEGDISKLDPDTLYGDKLTLQPITYSVYYIDKHAKNDVVYNTAKVFEYRNLVLEDHDEDTVETRFMDTFTVNPKAGPPYNPKDKENSWWNPLTGDYLNLLPWICTLGAGAGIGSAGYLKRRSRGRSVGVEGSTVHTYVPFGDSIDDSVFASVTDDGW